ncbi:MAG TPA: DJ-1/PfpI family protein [Planctomycetota bacterium]|nr:DJ-1/PfpI family protein [Planctomycetota bacterium]
MHALIRFLGSASLALVVAAPACTAPRDEPMTIVAPAAVVGSSSPSPAPAADPLPAPAREPALKRLGILVFPGVQVIDFTGPYEVLSAVHFRGDKVFDVITVGLTADELRTSPGFEGLRLRPDATIDDSPPLDVLLIPGGEIGAVEDDARAMAWIAKAVEQAECVMSVCNGAFILAKGGHLRNQRATTFYYFIDELKEAEPTCTPVHDERFVDNGKIITTAGLSSGIDGALHLVERYTDRFTAEQLALGLEYHWQPESDWARGNLADRHYISMVGAGFDFPEGSVRGWTTVENTGSTEHWTKRWTLESALSRAELFALLEPKLAAAWRRGAAPGCSAWEFEDEQGRPWRAEFTLEGGGDGEWMLDLRMEKQ